jgi:hypothetical protein
MKLGQYRAVKTTKVGPYVAPVSTVAVVKCCWYVHSRVCCACYGTSLQVTMFIF